MRRKNCFGNGGRNNNTIFILFGVLVVLAFVMTNNKSNFGEDTSGSISLSGTSGVITFYHVPSTTTFSYDANKKGYVTKDNNSLNEYTLISGDRKQITGDLWIRKYITYNNKPYNNNPYLFVRIPHDNLNGVNSIDITTSALTPFDYIPIKINGQEVKNIIIDTLINNVQSSPYVINTVLTSLTPSVTPTLTSCSTLDKVGCIEKNGCYYNDNDDTCYTKQTTSGCSVYQINEDLGTIISSNKKTKARFVDTACPTTCNAIINKSLCVKNGQKANANKISTSFYYPNFKPPPPCRLNKLKEITELIKCTKLIYEAPVAQWIEHLASNQKVVGSIPIRSAIN